jgi:hypothetical protein
VDRVSSGTIVHSASWKLRTEVRYDYLLWALAGIPSSLSARSPALVRFVLARALGASPFSPAGLFFIRLRILDWRWGWLGQSRSPFSQVALGTRGPGGSTTWTCPNCTSP